MRRRGEIWLADLNPRRGTEPGKTRPVVIVQAQVLLDAEHPSTLVVPLTTQLVDAAEPLRICIRASGSLKKDSEARRFAPQSSAGSWRAPVPSWRDTRWQSVFGLPYRS